MQQLTPYWSDQALNGRPWGSKVGDEVGQCSKVALVENGCELTREQWMQEFFLYSPLLHCRQGRDYLQAHRVCKGASVSVSPFVVLPLRPFFVFFLLFCFLMLACLCLPLSLRAASRTADINNDRVCLPCDFTH